jgi:hypothetical protein
MTLIHEDCYRNHSTVSITLPSDKNASLVNANADGAFQVVARVTGATRASDLFQRATGPTRVSLAIGR